MKKNFIMLIICVALLAAAGGVYAVLMLTDDQNSDSTSESFSSIDESTIPVSLFEFEKTDIKSVSVKNSDGKEEFTGIPDGKPDEDGNVTFTIEGLQDLDINTTSTSSLLNSASALNSESTVEENPSDLEKYGLKTPVSEITVKAGSGEKTILIGNDSPVKGNTYCMEKNANTVYLVSTSNISIFLNSKEYFVSTSLLTKPEEIPKINQVKIERTDLDYDIVLDYDKKADEQETASGTLATHIMSEPISAYLDSEKSQNAINGMFGLSADSVIAIHPTDTEIAASGFDEPLCTVTMNTDEPSEHILKLGNKVVTDNGGSSYFAMFDDNKVIYSISSSTAVWAELNPGDIMSKLIFGTYVWDIGRLDINVNGGENVSFKGKGTSEDDYTVTKNNEECDKERFRTFYTFLLKASAEEFTLDEKPEGEPIVSVELETQDGKTKQKVEFYKSGGKKALISVNGTPCFKCRMAYVELLINNLDKFDTGEDFVMNW